MPRPSDMGNAGERPKRNKRGKTHLERSIVAFIYIFLRYEFHRPLQYFLYAEKNALHSLM